MLVVPDFTIDFNYNFFPKTKGESLLIPLYYFNPKVFYSNFRSNPKPLNS